MSERKFDYESDLAIDKHKLDEELLLQAQKMMRYSLAHAQAQLDRDKAKQALDITKAELDQSIRTELSASGSKFTEAVIDSKIKTSPNYIEAQERLREAEHDVNVTFAGVMAMNARRPILEDLVKLYLSSYWSEPHVQGDSKMKAAASQKATEKSIIENQPPPMYCVKPANGDGYIAGPYTTKEEAFEKAGKLPQNDFMIVKKFPDGGEEIITEKSYRKPTPKRSALRK